MERYGKRVKGVMSSQIMYYERFGRGQFHESMQLIQSASYPANLDSLRYLSSHSIHYIHVHKSLSINDPFKNRFLAFDVPSPSLFSEPFESRYGLLVQTYHTALHQLVVSCKERIRELEWGWWIGRSEYYSYSI